MLGSPSSAINGLTAAQKFTPDASGPAFRWLELKADGTTLTAFKAVVSSLRAILGDFRLSRTQALTTTE